MSGVGKKIKIKVDPWVQDEKDRFFSLFCIIFHNFMTVRVKLSHLEADFDIFRCINRFRGGNTP